MVYVQLPTHCRGLLITLEYPQAEKAGPPFSVDATHVHALFDAAWQVDQLERRDILDQEPRFRDEGVTGLSTAVYRLHAAETAVGCCTPITSQLHGLHAASAAG